jgi:hypothetical protein
MKRQYCEAHKDLSTGFSEYCGSSRTSVQLIERQYCEVMKMHPPDSQNIVAVVEHQFS